jgi:acetyl-CoA carboxylase carboxyl transferase subunit beta
MNIKLKKNSRLLKILTKKPVSAANDMNSGAIALAASA